MVVQEKDCQVQTEAKMSSAQLWQHVIDGFAISIILITVTMMVYAGYRAIVVIWRLKK